MKDLGLGFFFLGAVIAACLFIDTCVRARRDYELRVRVINAAEFACPAGSASPPEHR